ncbi:DUF1093 domain-containing protein [Bacillus cytotoxicus]|uniref:DUF1093 domain-containing protein n=1 Tax=Bacillus cytotoxicus TaxID=580165 RepID=UPI00244C8AFA|nr:DUF1093 domain-containing protein [Bacillus cytotoxicus]MDH2880326.1 YxeA family protein [Bacillus cytotoxicus]
MYYSPGIQNEAGRYNYELFTYNQQGKKKRLVFSARNQLRKESYIRLYYTLFRVLRTGKRFNLRNCQK